ncbi:conserved Plasmodium protein, unknown function [Plasmodium malariae]|uniref:Uncharacterized protein n=1 Tax=Plasmodium malariae TaxID=5858 RepID=A0A1D3TD57_PLAMA|nr:conserved Plasmodium protein, unknown function [Plasmodium malariae]SCP02782.1 conserved Plasmodium protein, unknown function [Plasmodium malariae]
MLRNVGKEHSNSFNVDKTKERNNIYNRRIDKEIKNLKESKLIDNENVYITLNENNNVDEDNDTHNCDNIKKNKYLYLLETFNEKYFLNKNFFFKNFINHVKILKSNQTTSFYTNQNENWPSIFAELSKYNTYKNSLCPFFNIYELLRFRGIFADFSSFLKEISYFLEIFEVFKNEFMKEQNSFNVSSTNKAVKSYSEREAKEKKEEEQDEFNFFTNIFFEILYKDFTNHLRNVQSEIINKILYSNEFEKEYFYNTFSVFFHKYYSIKESIVYSFFIFDDYPFSKPCVNLDHLPFCLLKKKSQEKLTGDKYNKRNILNLLLSEKKWVPKITIENLFEESQKFVHTLFFYYQYKIYLLYYYMSKHNIFFRFFENNCEINFETHSLVYSYVHNVDRQLATHIHKKKKKNYSNLLYRINNCECINQDFILYKFFYTYKKLKSKNYQVKGTPSSSFTRAERKKRYEYYIYFFFLIFVFLLPQLIKSLYIYRTSEIINYLNLSNSASLTFQEDKQNTSVNNHPLFYAYIKLLKKITNNENTKGENTHNSSSLSNGGENAEENEQRKATFNHSNKKKKNENGTIIDEEKGTNDQQAVRGEEKGKSEQNLMNGEEKLRNEQIHLSSVDRGSARVNTRLSDGEGGAINLLLIITMLSVTEFLFFSLGVIYNLKLLRKKFEHNNFVINICSSVLILYNPILFCGNTNYVVVLSIGLLFWSINFILLKKMFLSVIIYVVSIYMNIANITYVFPFLCIYVYIKSRCIIKRGSQFKGIFKNRFEASKYIFIYLLIFVMESYFLMYILCDEQFYWYRNLRNCFNFFTSHFDSTEKVFMQYRQSKNLVHTVTTIFSSSNTLINHYRVVTYAPFIITIIFNYFFVVNTVNKLYSSFIVSSIVFLLTWWTHLSCTYLLTFLLVLLLLFINILGSSSLFLNILFSSYIIITDENFNFYIFALTIVYFLFHIYLMSPSSNFIQNINYQAKIGAHLIAHIFNYLLTNIVHLYETSIKSFVSSFVIMLFSSSSSSIITLPNEKDIQEIVQKKEIQKKIIFCLYSHLSHDYLIIPLSYFSAFLFLMLGSLKLCFPRVSIKFAVFILKLFILLSLLTILLIFYTKRKKFRKFDFLSIPHSAYKTTFPLQRSKKF